MHRVHHERHRDFRPRRLLGMDRAPQWSEKNGLPNMFPGRAMGRSNYSESECESDRSLGRTSSWSAASDSSLGPRASAGSVTPRQRRPRSRSGSSFDGSHLAELRDHLHHHIRDPPAPPIHERLGTSSITPKRPGTPASTPKRPGTPASPALRYTAEPIWSDFGKRKALSASASASALLASCSESSMELGLQLRGSPHGVKLPMLKHSESAPLLNAPVRKSHSRRDVSGTSLRETSVDERVGEEDDLELVDLGPSRAAVAAAESGRPITAWGKQLVHAHVDDRPSTRGYAGEERPTTRGNAGNDRPTRDGYVRGPPSRDKRPPTRDRDMRPSTRDSTRDGWQLSLCQNVAIHCPSSLPSKETFAQRKVPRPVSPLPGSGSRPTSPAADDTKRSQATSLHDSIGDLLQNMRRISDSTSPVESDGDGVSDSAEHAISELR